MHHCPVGFLSVMTCPSRFSSLTTAARASGFTPDSQRLTQMDNVSLSRPVLRIPEMSHTAAIEKGKDREPEEKEKEEGWRVKTNSRDESEENTNKNRPPFPSLYETLGNKRGPNNTTQSSTLTIQRSRCFCNLIQLSGRHLKTVTDWPTAVTFAIFECLVNQENLFRIFNLNRPRTFHLS